MYAELFLLLLFVQTSQTFSCPNANGMYVNPDDYRSYYVCSERCSTLQYCGWPTIYYTRMNQACVGEPADWTPRFNLAGQFKSSQNEHVFVQQEGYNLYIFQETTSARYELHARYINQTHAIGKQTLHQFENNCIAVFNIRIVAIRDSEYCYYESLHPYSTRCNLPINYSGNYCKSY